MARALVVHEYGGPEVLTWEEVPVAAPGPGQVSIRHTAVGLNMADTYRRRGVYPLKLPVIVGSEGAGTVEALGSGVDGLAVGDRVAYAGPLGAYAEERTVAADKIVRLPDGIDDRTAAAMMLKGLTVHYLLYWTCAVQPGDTVVIHAAAGGVGLIFCQWAKHLGATVIGTVGSDEKAGLAASHGCDHPIVYTRENFADRVLEITGGEGAHAVYDSIGADTFLDSIRCLRPRGTVAGFGQASGPFPDLDTGLLQQGSKFVTRPGLADHIATRGMIETAAGRLFDLVKRGVVTINVNQDWPLSEAAEAHRAIESRATTGSTVLIP